MKVLEKDVCPFHIVAQSLGRQILVSEYMKESSRYTDGTISELLRNLRYFGKHLDFEVDVKKAPDNPEGHCQACQGPQKPRDESPVTLLSLSPSSVARPTSRQID